MRRQINDKQRLSEMATNKNGSAPNKQRLFVGADDNPRESVSG